MWRAIKILLLALSHRVIECSKGWCDLWDSISESLNDPILIPHFCACRDLLNILRLSHLYPVYVSCHQGKKQETVWHFPSKPRSIVWQGSYFWLSAGKKVITLGRDSLYILMHGFVRNPHVMHHYKNKWAQIPHHCLHGILSLSSEVYFFTFVSLGSQTKNSTPWFHLKGNESFRKIKTSS